MAKSLNSDYVAQVALAECVRYYKARRSAAVPGCVYGFLQIFISPDTRNLDGNLFSAGLEPLDVPEQARSMIIFKRGYEVSGYLNQCVWWVRHLMHHLMTHAAQSAVRYGQARRKGRMLVAKLDYLQYIVVRSFVNNLAIQTRNVWQVIGSRLNPRGEGVQCL